MTVSATRAAGTGQPRCLAGRLARRGCGWVLIRPWRARGGRWSSTAGGRVPLVAPQRDAEADQGDTFGDGQRPVERLRQDGERGGGDACSREQQHRGPAGQTCGPEQGDAEDEPAEHVAGTGDVEQDLQVADVTGRGAAGGGDDDVVDEAGLGVGERWGGRTRPSARWPEDQQVAGSEQRGSRPGRGLRIWRTWRRYMPVMPASARAAMTALAVQRTTHSLVVGGERVDRRVVDLDGDEDRSRRRLRRRRRPG